MIDIAIIINNILSPQNIITPEKQIQSIDDSINYINNRLVSYYNTEQEKADIQRNLDHVNLMLSNESLLTLISEEKLLQYKDTIYQAEARINVE